mgnify:CR=1 FL=1
MVIRTGIIGYNEGNGHPFSFSAIINGYDADAFSKVGWPVILEYLNRQPKEAFGISGVCVTHAWTQDPIITKNLCSACNIENAVTHYEEMLGEIDALIIARDDWECHAQISLPFLKEGIPVFIDKPLTLDLKEMEVFKPYLEAGLLMSTSGLRFASELDDLRNDLEQLGSIKLISATVLNGIEKYGIHMLDAVTGLGLPKVVKIHRLQSKHESFFYTLENGISMQLHCIGSVNKTFHLSLYGNKAHAHFDLHDNFTAFSRSLRYFFNMYKHSTIIIPPSQIIDTMKLIKASIALAPGEMLDLENG